MLDRLRLLAAGLFCAAYLAVFGYILIVDQDESWPVSIYPMFSEGRVKGRPVQVLRIYGVTARPDGETVEERISSFPPLDSSRLAAGLARMNGVERAAVLRYVRQLYPRFVRVRLYRERWEAGGTKLRERELLVEATP